MHHSAPAWPRFCLPDSTTEAFSNTDSRDRQVPRRLNVLRATRRRRDSRGSSAVFRGIKTACISRNTPLEFNLFISYLLVRRERWLFWVISQLSSVSSTIRSSKVLQGPQPSKLLVVPVEPLSRTFDRGLRDQVSKRDVPRTTRQGPPGLPGPTRSKQ